MTRLVLACLAAAWLAVPASAQEADLERNLRWMLQRERRKDAPKARVGVFADAGAWHVGARSLVELLEKDGVPCRVLDRTRLDDEGLKGLEAVVFPGGWAPSQRFGAGDKGLAAVRRHVERGGRCLGICAGAYLLSRTVRYDGKDYPYPLGLFDGIAAGPVKGLAAYPKPGTARLTATEAGKKRGLGALASRPAYYSGGPFFLEGSRATVLATYGDGSAAIISRRVGKGEAVLVGAHLERPSLPKGDDAPAPKGAAALFRALLLDKPRSSRSGR